MQNDEDPLERFIDKYPRTSAFLLIIMSVAMSAFAASADRPLAVWFFLILGALVTIGLVITWICDIFRNM